MTREELAATAKVVNTGKLTAWLRDLEQSGFIKRSYALGAATRKGAERRSEVTADDLFRG